MPSASDSSSPPRHRRRRGRRRQRSSSSPSAPARSRPGRLACILIGISALIGDAAALLSVPPDPAALLSGGSPRSCTHFSALSPLSQVCCRGPPPFAGGSGSLQYFSDGFSGPGPTLRLCLRSWSLRPACRFVRPWHSCRLLACHGFPSALFRSRFLPSSSAFSSPPVTFVVIMARIGGDHPLRALAGRIVGSIAGPDSLGSQSATPARDGSASGASVPVAGAVQTAPAQPAPAASGDGQANPAQVDSTQPAAGPSVTAPTSGSQFLGPTVPIKNPPAYPPTTDGASSAPASFPPAGPPKKKSSFPPAYPAPAPKNQATAASSTAAPPPQPAPNPAADQGNIGPEQLLFQLNVLSDDDLYRCLADLPVSHLARLYGITAEVVIDQLYAITNLAQLDIELPISQMASAAAPPPPGRYPDRSVGRLDPIPSGPRFPDRAAAEALHPLRPPTVCAAPPSGPDRHISHSSWHPAGALGSEPGRGSPRVRCLRPPHPQAHPAGSVVPLRRMVPPQHLHPGPARPVSAQ